ncbi:MAG: hypothetical protein FWD42_05500, partial [Solirubrobacterales bacterium]|nr:hypothetical protein [Solirubrobacterales bacterium]
MPLVQDRPHEAPASHTAPERGLVDLRWPDPQQGVIEEARRRQERRRTRLAIASVAATLLIALLWALMEDPRATPAHRGAAGRAPVANPNGARAPGFNVRLAPGLEVGRAHWQVFYEEHGAQMGAVTTAPPVGSDVYLAFDGGSADGSRWTTRVVTTSEVAAILVEGRTRVPTVPLRGLPYAYRAARISTPVELTASSVVPLDAGGHPLLARPRSRDPIQARVRSWRYPGRAPAGSCGLRSSPLPALTAQGGSVATAIRPYPATAGAGGGGGGGRLVGRAFLPCLSVA